jgi:hypothetical protein
MEMEDLLHGVRLDLARRSSGQLFSAAPSWVRCDARQWMRMKMDGFRV